MLRVRMEASEWQTLTENAKESGLTTSGYTRRKALGRRVDSRADMQAINELRRLGGLLKMTHTTTQGVYAETTASILCDIRKTIESLSPEIAKELTQA